MTRMRDGKVVAPPSSSPRRCSLLELKTGEKNEERGEKRKREEEKEGNQTERVKRRMNGLCSLEAFEILSRVRIGELWWSFLVGPLGEA